MSWEESCLDWFGVATREWDAGNFRVAVIAAYTAVSQACEEYVRRTGRHQDGEFKFSLALHYLRSQGVIDDWHFKKLHRLRKARNKAIHHPYLAPERDAVKSFIHHAMGFFRILGISLESYTQATFDGISYSTQWPRETIVLESFRSEHLGIATFTPKSWDVHEEDGFLCFDFPCDRLHFRILTFRRVGGFNDAGLRETISKELLPAVRRTGFDLTDLTDSFECKKTHALHGGGRDIDIFHYSELLLFNGEIAVFHISGGQHLIISWHCWGDSNAWLPLLSEIAKRTEVFSPSITFASFREQVLSAIVVPQFSDKRDYELRLPSVGSHAAFNHTESLDEVDFILTKMGVRLNAGMIEGFSTITLNKVIRWKEINKLANEVFVYIPAPFVGQVRKYREHLGDCIKIFSVAYDVKSGRISADRMPL